MHLRFPSESEYYENNLSTQQDVYFKSNYPMVMLKNNFVHLFSDAKGYLCRWYRKKVTTLMHDILSLTIYFYIATYILVRW